MEIFRKERKDKFPESKMRRVCSTHSIKETYKIIKGRDHEGRTTINQYTFVRNLGKGSFGKVKLAVKNDTCENFAIKIFKKSFLKKKKEYIKQEKGMLIKDALQDVMKEIAIMKKFDHQNVIKLYEVMDDPEEDTLFMILEFAEKGQMIEWSEEEENFFFTKEHSQEFLSEDFLRKTFRDIIKGLYYLHNNGVIHRDLKPQNIVFDEKGIAKIADFGVSHLMDDLQNDKLKSSAGTYHFMSPEQCNPITKKKGYSGKMADIWGLGITLYAFTFKNVPFRGENVCELLDNIENMPLNFSQNKEISPELKSFLEQLLQKDPEKRISMDEILDNEWINKGFQNLKIEIDTDIVEITDFDIKNALIPLHTIVFLKKFVKNWRERSSSRSNSPHSEGGSPLNPPPSLIRRSGGKSIYSKLQIKKLNNKEFNDQIKTKNSITLGEDDFIQGMEDSHQKMDDSLQKMKDSYLFRKVESPMLMSKDSPLFNTVMGEIHMENSDNSYYNINFRKVETFQELK